MEKYQLVETFNDTIEKCQTIFKPMVDEAVNVYYPENERFLIEEFHRKINIRFLKKTTIATIIENKDKVYGVLNFASAKNPGGGAHKGSIAQEESIARTSTLVPVIKKCVAFYDSPLSAPEYSDRIIYSKPIYVFKNDYFQDIEPVKCEVITCAAPNYNYSEFIPTSHKKLIKTRFTKILHVAILNNQRNLILGAWGCGVFKNPPHTNAEIFYNVLNEYGRYFDEIIFAIPDDKHYNIFKSVYK